MSDPYGVIGATKRTTPIIHSTFFLKLQILGNWFALCSENSTKLHANPR